MRETQDDAIAFLADPASHGREVEAVERIDTHISIVFLAGTRVFKLKRAVTLPFLDYGTLEKRQFYCEREVSLNRRTAPDLYRGVRAITREAGGRLAFDGDGPVVEWVVEMERFDAAGLFSCLAASRELTRDMVVEAVDAVVGLHRSAEIVRDAGTAEGGGLDPTIEELRAGLARQSDTLAHARVVAYVEALSHANEAVRPLLARRFADGWVRVCHGDLHLNNICTFRGRPTIFDAAEANDRFMRIDVLYDLAFLLMDLEHCGLGGHANAALNRYLDADEDVANLDGLAGLPLFLSTRAAIRAEISALTVANVADPSAAAGHRATARRYLELAEGYLVPPPAGLVAVGGASGTGKTTLARLLAPGLGAAPGAVVVRSDRVRKALFGVGETERLPDAAYTVEWHRRTYEAVAARVRKILAAGHSCIVDAVHGTERSRAASAALAAEAGVPFHGIWLEAPADRLRNRVGARSGDASDADARVVARQLAGGFGMVDWTRVDAAGPPEQVAAAVSDALAAGPVAASQRPPPATPGARA